MIASEMDERRADDSRIAVLEVQVMRLVSDYESEKDTRSRVNSEIFKKFDEAEKRFRQIERYIWMSAGAVGVIVFVANFLFK